MPLARDHDRGHPVMAIRGDITRVGSKERARLHHGGGASETGQLIPPRRIARDGAAGDTRVIHADGMRCPQPAIAHMRGHEPVIDGIQQPVGRVIVTEVRDMDRRMCGSHGDGDIRGQRGRAAGRAHTPEHELAGAGIVRPDEVALRRRRVIVIRTMRVGRPRTADAARQIAKGADNNRPRAEDGTLADDKGRAARESASRSKDGDTHIDSICIHTQRRVIREVTRVPGGRDEILLKGKVSPHRRAIDCPVVTHREQQLIGARDIREGRHYPPAREPVIPHPRVAGQAAPAHCRKEHIQVRIQRTHRAGDFVKDADASIEHDHELRRAHHTHRVGWVRTGRIRQRRRREV